MHGLDWTTVVFSAPVMDRTVHVHQVMDGPCNDVVWCGGVMKGKTDRHASNTNIVVVVAALVLETHAASLPDEHLFPWD